MLKQRSVSEQDRTKIEQWIQADDDHRGKCKPDFWIPSGEPHVIHFCVRDEQGDIFFVRGEMVLRLHIQFAPPSERKRLAKAIDEFTPIIAAGAKKQGYKQIIFESMVEPLIRFLHARGFRSSKDEQVRDL